MIEVKNLTKKYGNFEALSSLSFSAGGRQVLGFLGPNGAGKTTLMKILTGYHFPTSGEVAVDGISLEENPLEIKKRIGYLPENNPLYGDMTPEEYLDFSAAARLVPGSGRKKAVKNALDLCGLGAYKKKLIEKLSKGLKQRVGLAQAIIHDPPILVLDEPASGLDPNQIVETRSLIRELGKKKTVIISTHILREVEAVCSRVFILNGGRLAAQGAPEEIAGSLNGLSQTWELFLKGADARDAERRLDIKDREITGVKAETLENGAVKLCFVIKNSAPPADGTDFSRGVKNPGDDGELVFGWAVGQGYTITGMSRKKTSLEDIFVRLTASSGGGQPPANMPLSPGEGEKK